MCLPIFERPAIYFQQLCQHWSLDRVSGNMLPIRESLISVFILFVLRHLLAKYFFTSRLFDAAVIFAFAVGFGVGAPENGKLRVHCLLTYTYYIEASSSSANCRSSIPKFLRPPFRCHGSKGGLEGGTSAFRKSLVN